MTLIITKSLYLLIHTISMKINFYFKNPSVLICLLGCFSTASLIHLIYPDFGTSILPNKIKETRVIIIIHDNYKE